jgi:ubiquinone/menaquinone biosynthesis C-methylase UbiE
MRDTNYYPVDPNATIELSRLLQQDQLLTETISGLLPPNLDPGTLQTVLDLGCGPGGWLIELARHYPHMHLTGLDISEQTINYAKKIAEMERHSRLKFLQGSFATLPFPSHHFDLVNARLVLWFVDAQDRIEILKEWHRVVRPGGWIRLIEAELPQTNGPASEYLNRMFLEMMHSSGKTFLGQMLKSDALQKLWQETPELLVPLRHHGIILALRSFLEDLGCENIHLEARVLDYSAGRPAHEAFVHNLLRAHQSYREYFLTFPGITPQLLDQMLKVSKQEMQSPNFLGLEFFLSVWGQKPLTAAQ